MNVMRNRAKEHFPSVLLTLLSIVQALALELLWSHVVETDFLFELTWIAVLSWAQISATFVGLVLIWVVYASNVMRFRWTPVTSDSVYPFFIGLVEFMLIESLGPDEIGHWLMLMGLTFGIMNWVAHVNLRRARQDADNAAFFVGRKPARLRDFYPEITIVSVLLIAGGYLLISNNQGFLAMFALLGTNILLVWQFYVAARFWERSMTEVPEVSSGGS